MVLTSSSRHRRIARRRGRRVDPVPGGSSRRLDGGNVVVCGRDCAGAGRGADRGAGVSASERARASANASEAM